MRMDLRVAVRAVLGAGFAGVAVAASPAASGQENRPELEEIAWRPEVEVFAPKLNVSSANFGFIAASCSSGIGLRSSTALNLPSSTSFLLAMK